VGACDKEQAGRSLLHGEGRSDMGGADGGVIELRWRARRSGGGRSSGGGMAVMMEWCDVGDLTAASTEKKFGD